MWFRLEKALSFNIPVRCTWPSALLFLLSIIDRSGSLNNNLQPIRQKKNEIGIFNPTHQSSSYQWVQAGRKSRIHRKWTG